MKIFENKKILKRVILILLCIIVVTFCLPGDVKASGDGANKLLDPVMSLFVSLGDGAMALIQKIIFHSDVSLINIDTHMSIIAKILVVVGVYLLVNIVAGLVILSGGTATIALGTIIGAIKTTLVIVGVATVTFPITTKLVEDMLPESFYLPVFSISPYEIFSNKIPMLDVDFFNPQESIDLPDGEKMESTATELKPTISSWYNILRNISMVALLSVLMYVGIRILISSTSNDKAKYKQMLIDWVVAMCLLFFIHYIMAFSNLFVEKIVDLIDGTNVHANMGEGKETDLTQPEMFDITDSKIIKKSYKVLVSDAVKNGDINSEEDSPYYSYFLNDSGSPGDGEKSTHFVWPAENFLQQARFKSQLLSEGGEYSYESVGWKMIYVVLVIYTIIFIYTYLKRLAYMTFLTLIAPLVALTYPIDKLNDGKAQAFNMWFKEYIFNLLIQPMHLILYMVLIGSAMDFASQNILYVLVALGFLVPGEKLLRKMFGFEKAQTPGFLGGPAGAALMMGGMSKLFGGKKSKSSKDASGSSSDDTDDASSPPFTNRNFNVQDAFLGDGNNQSESRAPEPDPTPGPRPDPDLNSDFNSNLGPALGPGPALGLGGGPGAQVEDANGNVEFPSNSNPNSGKKRKLGRFASAVASSAKYYARGTAKNVINNVGQKARNLHPVKDVAKFAAGGLGAVTLGTGAVLASIVGGDMTKGAQAVMGTAAGGYKLGSGFLDGTSKYTPNANDVEREFERSYYGSDEEYQKVQQKRYVDKYQRNSKNLEALEKAYGVKDAQKIMKNVVPEYVNNGITDINDIIAANDLLKEGKVKDRNVAIATAKYAKRVGKDTTKMTKKDRDEWRKTFSTEFGENDRVRSNPNLSADSLADNVLGNLDAFYKFKK